MAWQRETAIGEKVEMRRLNFEPTRLTDAQLKKLKAGAQPLQRPPPAARSRSAAPSPSR